MAQLNFRVVDNEVPHPRDIAKRRVKQFRTLVEQEKRPICNQSTGAPNLFVDDVLKRTERDMPEEVRPRYKVNPLVSLLLILFSIVGLVLLIYSMR